MKPKTVILELSNPDLEQQLLEAESQLREAEARLIEARSASPGSRPHGNIGPAASVSYVKGDS